MPQVCKSHSPEFMKQDRSMAPAQLFQHALVPDLGEALVLLMQCVADNPFLSFLLTSGHDMLSNFLAQYLARFASRRQEGVTGHLLPVPLSLLSKCA
eukprot:324323-Amphidinium_carterae.1